MRAVKWYEEIIAGGISGMAGVAIGHPFDTVKVLMQTDSKFKSPLQCLFNTIKKEGFWSLYKGLWPPLAFATVINAICFYSYEFSFRVMLNKKSSETESGRTRRATLAHVFAAGCCSGILQSIVCVPSEVVKCKQQIGSYKSVFDCIGKIIRTEGILGLYRGTSVTLLRDTPAFGVYFAVYRGVKDTLQESELEELPSSVVAGAAAGCSSWFSTYPLDTVKSAVQAVPEGSSQKHFVTVARELFRRHGPGYFFRGIAPCLIRAVPVNAVIFPVYELSLSLMGELMLPIQVPQHLEGIVASTR